MMMMMMIAKRPPPSTKKKLFTYLESTTHMQLLANVRYYQRIQCTHLNLNIAEETDTASELLIEEVSLVFFYFWNGFLYSISSCANTYKIFISSFYDMLLHSAATIFVCYHNILTYSNNNNDLKFSVLYETRLTVVISKNIYNFWGCSHAWETK